MPGHRLAVELTDFGNIAVAGPMVMVLVLWFWVARQRRLAQIIAINTACAIAADIVLKEVSRTLGGEFFGTPFQLSTGAPSGHAVMSMVTYGSVAVLFAIGSAGVLRFAAIGLALALIAAVAITRVTLHAHTPADVATGLLLGALFTALTAVAARRMRGGWPAMAPLLVGVLIVGLLMQVSGLRLTSSEVM
ncbi:MAG: phosphatase PAP2 family protein [Acidisphaera sp.]|nr:phosphatase PAP2 family protein [Acidisphaera sp.]